MRQDDEFMEMENYKTACGTLWPDQKKMEALVQRKARGKSIRHTKAAVLLAACIGIFACSIVGTAAVNHFQVQFLVDEKAIQAEAEFEKNKEEYRIHVQEENETGKEMTLAEQLGVYVVVHADIDTLGLVLGDQEIDITDEMRKSGEYETMWEKDGKSYLVKVTDGKEEPTVTITEQ